MVMWILAGGSTLVTSGRLREWFFSMLAVPDGLAQWIMAVTAVLATVASFGALYFVWMTVRISKATLQTTQEMASQTINESSRTNKLTHPPRFRVTRTMIYQSGKSSFPAPDFIPGEAITGITYVVNCGRYSATMLSNDLRFYWGEHGHLPMNHVYRWFADTQNIQSLRPVEPGPRGPDRCAYVISSGGLAYWTIETKVPGDFITRNSGRSHDLFVAGVIRFFGEDRDPRAQYFYQRYNNERQCFESLDDFSYVD